jgi:hypothetical protein
VTLSGTPPDTAAYREGGERKVSRSKIGSKVTEPGLGTMMTAAEVKRLEAERDKAKVEEAPFTCSLCGHKVVIEWVDGYPPKRSWKHRKKLIP